MIAAIRASARSASDPRRRKRFEAAETFHGRAQVADFELATRGELRRFGRGRRALRGLARGAECRVHPIEACVGAASARNVSGAAAPSSITFSKHGIASPSLPMLA
jgi:hypothetical protein